MKVLLPIDGSYHSDMIIQSVLDEPWPANTNFRLLAVAEPLHDITEKMHKIADILMGRLRQTIASAEQKLIEDIKISLAEATEKLRKKFGQDNVFDLFHEGAADEQILDVCQSWKPDLVVLGAHGTGGYEDNTLGSVCLKVISQAPCTMRIVHASSPPVAKRILLAINESINSQVAVEMLLERPYLPETEVQVLTVIHQKKKTAHSRFFQAPEITASENEFYALEKEQAEKLIEETRKKLENKFGKGKVSAQLLDGNVRNLILQKAQEWSADRIIMGAHERRQTLFEYFVGSITTAVVANTACSVELVRMASP